MRLRNFPFLLTLGVLLASSFPAVAATLYLRDAPPAGNPYHDGLHLTGAGSIGSWSGRAGMFDFYASFSDEPGTHFNLLTYCIDPYLPLSVGPIDGPGLPFTLTSPDEYGFSESLTLTLQKLWGNAFVPSMASPTAAVAFQFLLWEYIADPNFDFASGYIQLSNPDVLAQALAWHNALPSWTNTAYLHVVDGRAFGRQSFILHEHTHPVVENPEPSTWLMLGAGLLALRRFRR